MNIVYLFLFMTPVYSMLLNYKNNKIFDEDYYLKYHKNITKLGNNNVQTKIYKWFTGTLKNFLSISPINLCKTDDDCDFPEICCNIGSMNICCNPNTGVNIEQLQLIPVPVNMDIF
jgi:hypothetical protein